MAHTETGAEIVKTVSRAVDILAHLVVYGGILLFLWVMIAGVMGAFWAVANRVHAWLI